MRPVRPELVEGLFFFLKRSAEEKKRPFDKLRANGNERVIPIKGMSL